MQRRVNIAGLRLLSLERLIGPWLASENLDLRRVPSILTGWLTVPRFVRAMWVMLNTCFLSGSLGFWYTLGKGYPRDQKTP